MDDLSFRKAVYANPFTKDEAVIKAAEEDPKKQAFWASIKAMEIELQAAMKIPVPENLAEKLILRQSINEHNKSKRQKPWYLAVAASVLLAAVLSVGVMNSGHSTLTEDLLAHANHVEFELLKSSKVDLNAVNDKLASFNGHVDTNLGDILSANFCYLDKIKSLHVIVRTEHGLTSLFVIPNSISETISSTFSNATFKGASFLLESAKIIVVGENESDIQELQQRAKSALAFTG